MYFAHNKLQPFLQSALAAILFTLPGCMCNYGNHVNTKRWRVSGTNTYIYLNPSILKEFLQKLSSESMILLAITLRLIMVLQDIWRRVVGNVLSDNSPSNMLMALLLAAKYYCDYCDLRLLLAAVSKNGLRDRCIWNCVLCFVFTSTISLLWVLYIYIYIYIYIDIYRYI